jgi:phage terminase large subunit
VDDSGAQMKKIWGMSNPPDADTWWEDLLTNPPNNMHVTIQPSGLSPEADWVHLLDSGYYENLAELHANDQDWIDVFIHGQFGKSLQGMPVFRAFNRETHVAKENLRPMPTTLVIGVDAGLTPAAVMTQQTHDGRVLVLDTIASFDMGALRFCRERLKPMLISKYPGVTAHVVIDPAAFQRAQTDERTVADIFKAEGFSVVPARTNAVAARLGAVESYLTRTVNGNPAFLVNPDCMDIITGLAGKYRYKINTKGERDESPAKDHPVSDFMDALQYACLHSDGGGIFGSTVGSGRRELRKTTSAGWT